MGNADDWAKPASRIIRLLNFASTQATRLPLQWFLAEQFVQVGGGSVVGQEVECAVSFDVLRGAEECAPCSQSEA